MESSPSVKMGKIGVLTLENADEWFWKVESFLRGKGLWEVIEDVISAAGQFDSADSAARVDQTHGERAPVAPASIPLPPESLEDKKAEPEWMKKNWSAISVISTIVTPLDAKTLKQYRLAGEIWIYLKKFYQQNDPAILMKAMKRFTRWEMNPKHS